MRQSASMVQVCNKSPCDSVTESHLYILSDVCLKIPHVALRGESSLLCFQAGQCACTPADVQQRNSRCATEHELAGEFEPDARPAACNGDVCALERAHSSKQTSPGSRREGAFRKHLHFVYK